MSFQDAWDTTMAEYKALMRAGIDSGKIQVKTRDTRADVEALQDQIRLAKAGVK